MELQTTSLEPRTTQVLFTGNGREYFGIWIVNLLLSVLTLGIYSAWAKVRTLQYFYGHSRVDGQGFRYLATPLQILKGRLIAVAFFAVISLLSHFFPIFALIFAIVFLFLTPWLLNQSLKFNFRMTSYRNVRFGFNGTYLGSLLNFVIYPLLSLFTLFLALPLAMRALDKYIVQHSTYGKKSFQTAPDVSPYYAATFLSGLLSMGIVLLMGFIIGTSIYADPAAAAPENSMLVTATMFFSYALIGTLSGTLYQIWIRNHLFSRTRLEGLVELESTVPVSTALYVAVTNLLLLLVTAGLAFPWTKVRKAQLLAAGTKITLYPALDQLYDQLSTPSSVVAEELADLYDVDFALI
ncbi:YjgN family protein [Rheinheimera sp. F8]|uniref:YjgN family protein n=1 Tax=Rheinheimera sp. F8 TaxID=1763998 RepID=UPI000744AC61|nr:YjgN family protein [Rheinheimera sp. F8]ALZ75414.1 hypothetical protein ATY27_06365 [Rheinheimera sp. F8]ALZ77556.1 hypothetical protein ATY27_18495 [Rheinheimera sp. F8]